MPKRNYELICASLAALQCYLAGQSVKHIAAHAQVSESTVRRWIKAANPHGWTPASYKRFCDRQEEAYEKSLPSA